MKLNNRGWGLTEMLIMSAVLLIILLIIVVLVYYLYESLGQL